MSQLSHHCRRNAVSLPLADDMRRVQSKPAPLPRLTSFIVWSQEHVAKTSFRMFPQSRQKTSLVCSCQCLIGWFCVEKEGGRPEVGVFEPYDELLGRETRGHRGVGIMPELANVRTTHVQRNVPELDGPVPGPSS